MRAASQTRRSTGLLGALPWRTERRDLRAVATLLAEAEIDLDGGLGAELLALFGQRVNECRDFFRLRGVRARRSTVLQMAGRSLAGDSGQAAALDPLTRSLGQALLQALSDLIEVRAGHPVRRPVAVTEPLPPVAESKEPPTAQPVDGAAQAGAPWDRIYSALAAAPNPSARPEDIGSANDERRLDLAA